MFYTYEHLKFHAQLSFITSGPGELASQLQRLRYIHVAVRFALFLSM